jgi:hypothetical protein
MVQSVRPLRVERRPCYWAVGEIHHAVDDDGDVSTMPGVASDSPAS